MSVFEGIAMPECLDVGGRKEAEALIEKAEGASRRIGEDNLRKEIEAFDIGLPEAASITVIRWI
jgi:hypothetical protein